MLNREDFRPARALGALQCHQGWVNPHIPKNGFKSDNDMKKWDENLSGKVGIHGQNTGHKHHLHLQQIGSKVGFGGAEEQLPHCKKRRACPAGTPPAELWTMLLHASRNLSPAGLGIRYQRKRIEPVRTLSLLERLLCRVRSSGTAPLAWHHSSGAPLHKSNKAGTKKKRVVHVLPSMAKQFFKVLLRTRRDGWTPPAPADWLHGFWVAFLPSTIRWQQLVAEKGVESGQLLAWHPWSGERMELFSQSQYADDTTKQIIAEPGEDVQALAKRVRCSNDVFDRALADDGFSQNRGKEELLMHLVGTGSLADRLLVREGQVSLPGKVVTVARHLGSHLGEKAFFTHELPRRRQATMTAF